MPSTFPSPIESLKLRVTTGVSPNVSTFEQPILSATLQGNSVTITNQNLINAFNIQPLGTIFNTSVIVTYIPGTNDPLGDIISFPSLSNFVPQPIPNTLSVSQSSLTKNIRELPFSLSQFITTNSTGVLSYSTSDSSVATVDSSGLVTIQGLGTVTLTVLQAVSADRVYTQATASILFTVRLPIGTQLGLDIDGEKAGDNSGRSVSLSRDGNTVAIGGDLNDGSDANAGHVRIFDWNLLSNPNQWTQRGSDIDGEKAGDNSGYSISLSGDGNTVAIGAIFNDGSGPNAGHARVYDWNVPSNPNQWTQRGIDIDGETTVDYSGWSVSLSEDGNTVAIGGRFNDGWRLNAGHVRVYYWNVLSNPNQWTQLGLDIDGEKAGDNSGYSVSLSSDGNTVAIGAIFNDDSGSSSNAGHARVFDWNVPSNPNQWTQRGIDINGEATGDQSGYSVSISEDGNTVAIGAPYNDNTVSDSGQARIFDWNVPSNPNQWTQRGIDIDGDQVGSNSGWAVSLSGDGNTVAVGGPYTDASGLVDCGKVSVYFWNKLSTPNQWTKQSLDINGEAAGDLSGWSVSLSYDGTTLAVGGIGNDGSGSTSNIGHVRVYEYN